MIHHLTVLITALLFTGCATSRLPVISDSVTKAPEQKHHAPVPQQATHPYRQNGDYYYYDANGNLREDFLINKSVIDTNSGYYLLMQRYKRNPEYLIQQQLKRMNENKLPVIPHH